MSRNLVRDTATDREHLEHATTLALVSENYGPPTTDNDTRIRATNYEKIRAVLPKYSDETLHRFIAAAETNLCWSLETYLCSADADEEFVNDWITMEPTALSHDIDSVPVLRGLAQYEHLAPQQNGHYPLQRTPQVIAIVRATAHLREQGNGLLIDLNEELSAMEYIEDKKLRDLLTTHGNPNAVADIIIQRNITDAQQIVTLLATMDDTATAINRGIL